MASKGEARQGMKAKAFFQSIDCKVIPFDSLSQRSDLTFGMCDAGFCQGTINRNRPGIPLYYTYNAM